MLPVAILAGGLATRLRPLTQTIPKALIPICGKPFISHQLKLLRKHNITHVVICVGFLGEMIEEYVKDGSDFGLQVQYSYDGEELLGTGGSIKKALPLLGESFFVLYGDSYLRCGYQDIESSFVKSQKSALMTVIRNEGKWDASNVIYKENTILTYDKVNKTSEMAYIDYGLGILKKEVFTQYPKKFDLSILYQDLVQKQDLAGYEANERFYEIGSHSGIADLESLLYLSET